MNNDNELGIFVEDEELDTTIVATQCEESDCIDCD